MEAEFGGRILLVRYEDLSLNPTDMVKSILKFVELPVKKDIMDFVKTHTAKEKPVISRNKKTKKFEVKSNPYALARNSSATAFKWRDKMPWDEIQEIQNACRYFYHVS